jgi:hypothetical protein
LPSPTATPEEFTAAIERNVPEALGTHRAEGPPVPSNVPRQPNPIARLFSDWQPTSLDEGVRKTIDFYRK